MKEKLEHKSPLEKEIEQAFCKRAIKKGWLPIKLLQTNWNGIPDRMFLKDGKVFFVEFKRYGKIPTPLQAHRIKTLRKLKFHVLVIDRLGVQK
jgi:hypothetical protein